MMNQKLFNILGAYSLLWWMDKEAIIIQCHQCYDRCHNREEVHLARL